jgi:DNA repair protein RadC
VILLNCSVPQRFVIRDCQPVAVPSAASSADFRGDSPDQIQRFFRTVVEADLCFEPDKEVVVVLCLNARLLLKGWHVVSLGGLTECSCGVREVLRPVLLTGSYGFVLTHNHPSGDPSPSEADRRITRKIDEAASLMNLRFLDHVIVGNPEGGRSPYFSFHEHGFLI